MVKLYISTFNNDVSWIKKGIPIEVGADIRDTFRYELRDNTGDNISGENAYFGELTGLYWIWKNEHFEDSDVIGFCHYNKCLDITPEIAGDLIKKNPSVKWICSDTTEILAHDYLSDIKAIEQVLKENYPLYFDAWTRLYDSNGASRDNNCYPMQLFYTTKYELDRYCEFLFGVLFKVRDYIGEVDRTSYHKRYCAFLGERLLSVYILENKCEIVCIKRKTNKKMVRKLMHNLSFLGRVSFLHNIYLQFRNSSVFERYLDEEKSSWKK